MKIEFCPNAKGSGTASYLSFTSAAFTEAIRQAFNESPREVITRIVIERDGITAFFETKNSAVRT